MKIKKLKFEGFFLCKPNVFKDERGIFRRHLCLKELKKKNIIIEVVQGNISESFKKGTLRGFHYKNNPTKEFKILSCLKGSIYHVAVDLRKKSKTYKKYFSIRLNSKDNFSIIIPPMCANAFLTLEKNTLIHYYMGDYFEKEKYKGFRYNDPAFNVKWPFKPKLINSRDNNYKDFKF
jgi:dTDP-4-dehydrorhamnose 3,5-epimerase